MTSENAAAPEQRHRASQESMCEDMASLHRKVDALMAMQGQQSTQLTSVINIIKNVKGLESVTVDEERDTAVSDVLFRSGRSIAHLEVGASHDLLSSTEEGLLYCKVCVPSLDTSQSGDGKVCGVFKYDFLNGTSFRKDEPLPVAFKSLKRNVSIHFGSATHKQAAATASKKAVNIAGAFAKNVNVSRRALRTGYHVLKKSLPRAAYEDLVVMQVRNGLNLGDLNHSGSFITTLRDQVHTVMLGRITRFVNEQQCVSLVVDKITLWKRTLDVTAIVVTVPQAPEGSIVQSLVIAAPVVTDGSSDSLAKEIAGSLALVGVHHPDQLASICTDGQYLRGSVPAKLLQEMTAAAEPDRRSRPAVPAVWDPAHLLNLAEDDARKKFKCVQDAVQLITSVTKRHMYGKGFEALMSCEEATLRPKLWSETRFAPHASRVMKTFISNEAAMTTLLSEQTDTGRADASAHRDMHLLRGTYVCFSVSAAVIDLNFNIVYWLRTECGAARFYRHASDFELLNLTQICSK